jgi:P-type E1-E2 ATPase
MENKIKPETNPCLEKLHNANISTTMATGDNGLTAITVGRN